MNDDPAHPRFDTGLTKARDMLTHEVAVMGGPNLVIRSNARTNRYGVSLSRQTRIEDTGGRLPRPQRAPSLHSLRSLGPAGGQRQRDRAGDRALRGLERWGAKQMVDQAFRGFAALPTGGAPAWWEVLEVSRTATRSEVEAAYRQQVRQLHPDAGGDQDQFLMVKAAYEAAVREAL